MMDKKPRRNTFTSATRLWLAAPCAFKREGFTCLAGVEGRLEQLEHGLPIRCRWTMPWHLVAGGDKRPDTDLAGPSRDFGFGSRDDLRRSGFGFGCRDDLDLGSVLQTLVHIA
jgi:hypothetical protein